MPDPQIIVDTHEDIAFNALSFGRDFSRSVHLTRRLEANTPIPQVAGTAMTGLPEAILGRVGIIFGTLFTEPAWSKTGDAYQAVLYETPAEACQHALNEIDVYQRLADENERIRL